MLTSCSNTEKPTTPILTTLRPTQVDGDPLTLQCDTGTTEDIEIYEFKLESVSLVETTTSSYTIINPTIDQDDGSYTCVVYNQGFPSDPSPVLPVACESLSYFVLITSYVLHNIYSYIIKLNVSGFCGAIKS